MDTSNICNKAIALKLKVLSTMPRKLGAKIRLDFQPCISSAECGGINKVEIKTFFIPTSASSEVVIAVALDELFVDSRF